jgi:hypothetical protein
VATGAKKRGYETLRDMLLSLGVIVAGVLIFVALQPKNDHNPVPAVDYRAQVELLRRSAATAVVVPEPLPAGWDVNYTRIGSAGATELHMGLVRDRKRFAQLDETNRPTPSFFTDAKLPAQAAGSANAGGVTYEVRRADGHVALVRQVAGGGVVTLSDGGGDNGATYDELVALAASLRDLPPLGRA